MVKIKERILPAIRRNWFSIVVGTWMLWATFALCGLSGEIDDVSGQISAIADRLN